MRKITKEIDVLNVSERLTTCAAASSGVSPSASVSLQIQRDRGQGKMTKFEMRKDGQEMTTEERDSVVRVRQSQHQHYHHQHQHSKNTT